MEHYDTIGRSPKCIVFNHGTYTKGFAHMSRSDQQENHDLLATTFECMGFRNYEILNDLTKDDIFIKLTEVTSSDLSDFSSLIVFILTHGHLDYTLLASDELYKLTELIETAMNNLHTSLSEKPISFIVEACNGVRKDHGATKVTGPNVYYKATKATMSLYLPNYSDLFIAFSSSPEAPSYVAWFIPTLCEMFQNYHSKYDIEKLLTIIKQKVAAQNGIDSAELVKQMPMTISTLTKKLYLGN